MLLVGTLKSYPCSAYRSNNCENAVVLSYIRSAVLATLSFSLLAQPAVQEQIAAISADAYGKVSVACSLSGTALNCDLNPHAHPPMQSVFKAPLAFTALHLVERGSLSLDMPIRFRASDCIPGAYSPCRTNTLRAKSISLCASS